MKKNKKQIFMECLPSWYKAGINLTRAVPVKPHIGNIRLLHDPLIVR